MSNTAAKKVGNAIATEKKNATEKLTRGLVQTSKITLKKKYKPINFYLYPFL